MIITTRDRSASTRFNRSLLRSVPLSNGEACHWKRHFLNVLREVMGYLEAQARLHPIERFTWVHVGTIAAHCNQFRKGKKPYTLRYIKMALAFLEQKGIIARVQRMEWRGRIIHGYLVSPHDHACRVVDGRCQFSCGGLSDLGFDKPGVTVTRQEFFELPPEARKR